MKASNEEYIFKVLVITVDLMNRLLIEVRIGDGSILLAKPSKKGVI